MKTWTTWLSAFLLMFCLVCGASALAASAWVSVPSTPDSSDKVVITGGNLLPWSTAKVLIRAPDGTNSEQQVTITAEGTLSVAHLPVMPGTYSVKVYDQAETEIGGGNFIYLK